jgi:hypothetical protein
MLAFINTTVTKKAVLEQLRAHAEADELVKGHYWEAGKGCAVGCTIHSSRHVEYEVRFGIPEMLARLEDCIFEGLPNGTAKAWPVRFMTAVRPGSDLSYVGWKFLHWLLTDEKVNPGINHSLVRGAVKQCADVLASLSKGLPIAASAARAARSAASAARSAARAARSAARAVSAESAAWSAVSAESAAWSAESAAWSAERSAESAAWSAARSAESAESAAWSAASAARRAARAVSAESAAWSAESAAYILMSEKLIKLIEAAPLAEAEGKP